MKKLFFVMFIMSACTLSPEIIDERNMYGECIDSDSDGIFDYDAGFADASLIYNCVTACNNMVFKKCITYPDECREICAEIELLNTYSYECMSLLIDCNNWMVRCRPENYYN